MSAAVPVPARAGLRRAPHRGWLFATTALLPIAAGPVAAQTLPAPNTGPTGGQVVAGQATIGRTTSTTTITQGTDRAAINWQQFNVGADHTVQFVQPGQGSWTLNRVTTPDPSVIAGRVQANGGVAIVNQSGVVFAQGAQVNVSSLIASAAGISNENFMAGQMVFDQAPRPGARVENHGSITVADRGLAALVAPGVSNSGVIRARLGRVALGAAETFVLDLAGDGLINIDVTQAVRTAPEGGQALVTNSGVIDAAGGSVLLTAHAASGLVEDLVRQTGTINVQTVGERTGQAVLRAEGGGVRLDGAIDATGGASQRGGNVALQATGAVTVSGTARVDASGGAGGGQVLVGTTGRGRNQTMAARTTVAQGAVIRADATGAGNGGTIVVNSTDATEVRGTLSARGGASGGNGGFIETSGQQSLLISGFIDLSAPSGTPGELLLDPQNIIVSSNSNVNPPGGGSTVTDTATTPAANFTATTGNNNQWLRVDPGAIEGFTGTVTLDAGNNIVVDSAINKTNGGLGLTAGDSITISANVSVSGALTLAATAGSIGIDANLRAASITMAAATGIAQTAGTIASVSGVGTALQLSATTTAGNITLDQVGNGSLALTFSAPGTVSVQSGDFANGQSGGTAGAIQIAGASSGGDVTLVATRQNNNNATAGTGTIAVNASLTSAAGVTLDADGAITQTASGTIITARDSTGILRIRNRTDGNGTAAGSAALDQAANQIAVLDARTTGALAVSSVGFAAGPGNVPPANPTLSVTLAEGGSVSLTAPRLALPNGAAATTGDVTLVATEVGGGAGAAATLTIGGAVTAVDEGTVRLRADRVDLSGASFDGAGAGNNLALLEIGPQTAGRAIAWGGTDGTNLFVDTASRTAIAGADATALRLGRTTVNAADVTAGDITFGSNLTFGGTLTLNGTGAITQAAATVLDVGTLNIRGATDATGAGSATLTLANVIDNLDALTVGALLVSSTAATLNVQGASGSSVLLSSAGGIALGDATVTGRAGTVVLLAGDGISQGTAGAIDAFGLIAQARNGDIALSGSGNNFRSVDNGGALAPDNGPLLTDTTRAVYASGTVSLATQGNLAINSAVESRSGLVEITAGSLSIGAPIAVSGGATPTLSLTADGSGGATGTITQTAAILTNALDVTASGSATLSLGTNSVATLLASSAGGTFALTTSGALTVAGALTTPDNSLIALTGTSITQSALIRAGNAVSPTGGTVSLTATAGDVTQNTGGRIVADTLNLFSNNATLRSGYAVGAGGDPLTWNRIGAASVDVVGNFALLNDGNLSFSGDVVGPAAGSTTFLSTSGILTLGPGSIRTEQITIAGGFGINILNTIGSGATSFVNLQTFGGTITEGPTASITTNELRIRAGGDVGLTSANNAISGIAAEATAADVAINVRSGVALSTIATNAQLLLANDTLVATPSGIISNDITLQAPTITIGAGAPLVRFDTNQTGSVTLITDNLVNGGGVIDLGDGGTFGIGFDNPNIAILVGDPVVDTNIVPIPLASYVIGATPVTDALTQWISGSYINNLPLSANTTNATLRIGSPGQTAPTFVIGALTPNARFTTFDLRGGDVIVGADITAPGRTVSIAAGANILPSGTYARTETILNYDIFLTPFITVQLNPAYLQANGVITANTLIATAGTGTVSLTSVAHNVGLLSGIAGTTFNYRDADGFQIGPAGPGGITAGTRVVLQADAGSITQGPGSPIVTPALEVSVPGGSLVLDGGSANSTLATDLNRIDSLTDVVFTNGLQAVGDVTIRNQGSLALNADVTTSGDVHLHSQTGNITQGGDGAAFSNTADLITATNLFVSAPAGSVLLTNGAAVATDPNVFANVLSGGLGASSVAGDLTLRTAGALNIVGAVTVGTAAGGTAGTATLLSRFSDITQQAGGSLAADSLTAVAPGGSVFLNGAATNSIATVLAGSVLTDFRLFTDDVLTVSGPIAGAGTIALQSGSDLAVNGTLSAATIALQSGGNVTTAATITGTAGGAVSVLGNGTVDVGAGVSGGTIRVLGGGALSLGANISGTSIELQGDGITLGAGGVGGTLTANRVLLRTGADFDPASGTTSGSGIVQIAGTIETSQFSASAPGGNVTLGATGNTFGTVVAGADSDGSAATAGIVAGGNVTLTADAAAQLTINSRILAGWTPSVTSPTVTLRADNLGVNALIDTRGPGATDRQTGTIDIAPLTTTRPVVLGGPTDYGPIGYLTLQDTELANLRAGTVVVTTANTTEGIYVLDNAPLGGLMTGGTTLSLSSGGFVSQFPNSTPTATLSVERLGITAAGFVSIASVSNLIGEAIGISSGSSIALTSASPLLTLSGPISSTLSGTSITIRANDLAIPAGGSITVPDGTVDISGVTAGRAISLGTEIGGTLGLSSAEIGRIGQTTNPLVLVTIGDTTSGTMTLQGDVSFRDAAVDASSAIGGVRALALRLTTDPTTADITQIGTTAGVNVANLAASGRQVALLSPANAVDTIDALTGATGNAGLRSLRDLSLPFGINASATGGTLALISDGVLTIGGGLSATGAAGDIALTGGAGLALLTTSTTDAGRDVTLTAGPATGNGVGTLGVNGWVRAGRDIAASATGTLTIAQDLTATAGNISLSTLSPGTQPAADVVIAAPSPVGPDIGGNAAVTEIRATGAGAGTVTLTATGAVSQAAVGTQIIANNLAVQAGADVGLGVAGNQVTVLQSLAAGSQATVAVQGALNVTGAATADDQLTLIAGTTLTIAATGSAQTTNPGGTVDLTGGTGLTVNGTVAGETINLTATTGQLAITGGTVTGGGAGTGGVVTLAGGSLLINGGSTVTGETITATLAGGAITLNGSTVTALGSAGVLDLATTGAIGVTGGSVGGNTVALDAGAAGLTVSGATLTGGSVGVSLTSAGLTSLSGGTTTVTGGTLLVQGQTGATISGGTHAATGGVTVNAPGGAAQILTANVSSASGPVVVSGTSATVTGSTLNAGAQVALTASTGNAAIGTSTIDAGTDVTLTANAGQATVTGSGVTAGRDIVLAGGTLAQVSGGTLDATRAVQIGATGGAAQVIGNANVSSGTGGITLTGTSALVDTSTIDAGTALGLTATTGNAAINAATIGAGTDVTLTANAGQATVTGSGVTAGGDVVLAGGTFAQVSGGTVDAGGAIQIGATGGAAQIIAGANVSSGTGGIALAGTSASIDTSTIDAGTTLALTGSAGNASINAGTTNAGTDVTLAAAGQATITGGGVTAGGDIGLSGGTLAQISGGTHSAGGAIALSSAGGAATLTGTTVTATTGAITVAGNPATITNSTVRAGTDIGLTASGSTAIVSGSALTAGASISVQGQTLARVTGGTGVADQNISITSAGGAAEALTTSLTATNGTLSLSGTAATMDAATLRAGTEIAMTATAGAVTTTSGSLASDGDITLLAAGTATLSGTITTALGATSITGQAGARLVSGTHSATGGLTLAAPGGTAELNTTSITSGAGSLVTVTGASALLTGGVVNAGSGLQVTATAGDAILAAPQLTTATTLGLTAAGAVQVQPGTSAAAGTDFTINAGGLTITNASVSAGHDLLMAIGSGAAFSAANVLAGNDIRLNAGGALTVSGGKFSAANEVALTGGTVALNQANIDPLAIRITSLGNMSIVNSSLTSDDIIRIIAGGTLTVRASNITGNSVGIESGGLLSLDGGLYLIRDVLVFASPTGIQTIGRVVVRPRGSDLPGVAFDTRSAAAVPEPLDIIVPDDPNLPANQQETQVRVPGTDAPGSFGAPNSNPAGTLNFQVDIGRSALFLLIDGGDATGDITTGGRVGIFGTGGTVTLTGTLIDFRGNQYTGGNASALTDSARPAPGSALARFTINNCVISSINCFVASQVVTIPQAPPQQIDLTLYGSRLTDPDVQIPNVAEEDY